MFKRIIVAGFVLLVVTSAVQAKDKSISGVLTKVEPGMIEIRISKQKMQSMVLTADTTYERWTLYKRMPIDRHADFGSLKIGTRVRVEFRLDNPMIARKVRIEIR